MSVSPHGADTRVGGLRPLTVFTRWAEDDPPVREYVIGTCSRCLRLHRFRVFAEVGTSRATTLSGAKVPMADAVKMVLGLSGRTLVPEPPHLRPCPVNEHGAELEVVDLPMSDYRRPLELPGEDNPPWIRCQPDTGEPPF